MEVNQQVWLRRESSHWGWVPAVIVRKEEIVVDDVELINLTLINDRTIEGSPQGGNSTNYFVDEENFTVVIQVDPESLKTADHDDIKLRNLPSSFQMSGEDPQAGVLTSPSTRIKNQIVGGVDDLIELTHLHEPAILHALRLRYDSNIIYTSTGPILIAVNPFKPMNNMYRPEMMEEYRLQGEQGVRNSSAENSPTKLPKYTSPHGKNGRKAVLDRESSSTNDRLAPHVYQTADDAYRQMLRGLENTNLMKKPRKQLVRGESAIADLEGVNPSNQSILVSGESGAGKTVTTKIVLNYFAMLSKKRAEDEQRSNPNADGSHSDVSIEQQVLQSNPILEAFGNARTIRNDNSSRFGKYIDISFTDKGKLVGASIETYLLEKVRLIHPGPGERNYHVFYQFLKAATARERQDFYLGSKTCQDFRLLSDSGTFDRRDGVNDEDMHFEMLEAMVRRARAFSCVFLVLMSG
jgi:myosin-5